MVSFRKTGATADTHACVRPVGRDATVIGTCKNRSIQVRSPRFDGWTKARRAQFLRVLGTTCNVRAAATDVGMGFGTAYALRLRDPAFAAAWAAALADGYDRLEEVLLAAAIAGLSGDFVAETHDADKRAAGGSACEAARDDAIDFGSDGAINSAIDSGSDLGGISVPDTGVVRLASMQAVQVALAMLGRFRAAQAKGGKRPKSHRRRATVEETNASIAKKLDALAKRLVAAPAVIVLSGVIGDDGNGAGAGAGADVFGTDACLPGSGMILKNGAQHER